MVFGPLFGSIVKSFSFCLKYTFDRFPNNSSTRYPNRSNENLAMLAKCSKTTSYSCLPIGSPVSPARIRTAPSTTSPLPKSAQAHSPRVTSRLYRVVRSLPYTVNLKLTVLTVQMTHRTVQMSHPSPVASLITPLRPTAQSTTRRPFAIAV